MKRQYGILLVLLLTNLCFAGGGQILNIATPISADVDRSDPAPPQVNPGNNNGIQFGTATADAADASVQTDADDTLDATPTPATVDNSASVAPLEEPAFELTCLKKIANSDSFEPDAAIAKRTVRLKQMKSVWSMNVYLNYCKDINPELLTRRKMVKVPVQTGPYLAAEAAVAVQQAVD